MQLLNIKTVVANPLDIVNRCQSRSVRAHLFCRSAFLILNNCLVVLLEMSATAITVSSPTVVTTVLPVTVPSSLAKIEVKTEISVQANDYEIERATGTLPARKRCIPLKYRYWSLSCLDFNAVYCKFVFLCLYDEKCMCAQGKVVRNAITIAVTTMFFFL
jgi:hypothetical protein